MKVSNLESEDRPADGQRVHATLSQLLLDRETGWGLGVYGAIAEFLHDDSDTYEICSPEHLTIATGRGAIRIRLGSGARLIAYEVPSDRGDHWNQGVAIILPERDAHLPISNGLTERGEDGDGIRQTDRIARLFDLGLPTKCINACIRTDDQSLVARLRTMTGASALDPAGEFGRTIVETSPHRVFLSALGRIEVYQPIPTSLEHVDLLAGPHTHLLPELLGREGQASWVPFVPTDHAVCLQAYPRNPLFDRLGQPVPFDAVAHTTFQELLGAWGHPGYLAGKIRVLASFRAGEAPGAYSRPDDAVQEAACKVALRQVLHVDGDSELLREWRARFDPPPTLKMSAGSIDSIGH